MKNLLALNSKQIIIGISFFLLFSFENFAATKTWNGSVSTDWGTAGNWSSSGVPGSGDDVIIPTTPSGGRMPAISTGSFSIKSLTIQSGGTLTQSGGTLLVSGANSSVTGTLNQSGGTLLFGNPITVETGGLISQSGTGLIHMATSTGASPTDHITIDNGGTINQSGGTIYTKDFTTNAGTPDATFNQTGGTLRMFHDFKNKGIFYSTGGTFQYSGDGGGGSFPAEVVSSNTQFYNVLIDAGIDPKFGTNAVTSFNVAGDWTNNSSMVTLDNKANTVIFNGSGTQTIGGTQSTTFRNFTINKTSGTVYLSSDQFINNGNLTITGGNLDLGNFSLNRASSGGTLSVSNGCIVRLASNTGGQTGSNFPLNFTTISFGSGSTVDYYGTNAITQTIYATTYGNLTLTNSSGSGTAAKNSTGNLTVNGTMDVTANTLFTPGASNTIAGTGTLTGSGTVQVTRTTSTADFNTQYSISNKTLSNLTVDYYATAAQTVNAHNYYNLTISGSRTTASVTLTNTGTIGISGIFNPSASFTSGNYVITSSTVDFNSSNTQNIPAFTFNNLTISGGSNKTATGLINVNNIFTLNSSILTTSSANLLVLNDNATSSGAAYIAYVNGPVKKTGNDAFTFPVGKTGAGYMLISISAPSLITDAFTAEYIRSSATGLGNITASGLKRVSNCDYWNLGRTNGSSNVDVTLSWNGYSNCNLAAYINDITAITVAHFDGTNWDSHAKNSYTGNASSGTITRNAVSTFSPFALGSTSDFANPLRIEFNSVNAYKINTDVRLEWNNLSETSVDHYEVEHSSNSRDFETVCVVFPKSNNGTAAAYEWFDRNVSTVIQYYRIKTISADGNITYSKTMKIDANTKSEQILFANPVTGNSINLSATNFEKGIYQVEIYSMNGEKILDKTFNHFGATLNERVELPAILSNGIYSLRISGNNYQQYKSIIINR